MKYPLNLDAMEAEELREAGLAYSRLSSYCQMRLKAGELRKEGWINHAQDIEQECDALYERLPDWAKW